ncbi:MAG: GDP-fucose synthetase [Deltaproteobacteria bacterium]|nr:MAG: GDP-fucose synthetase [Deltaproteobacteria bacterium]
MEKEAKIYLAGHDGLVGSALHRALKARGYEHLVTRSFAELDLRDQAAVADFFATVQPDYVLLAAARVGGILANNTYPAAFIYDNLMIQANVIHQSWVQGVKKLLFLGSSCIYPRMCPQPMTESHLMTGPLEPTNSPYAVAKISGIELCWAYNRQYGTRFIPVMPTNLYGPYDNFDLETSHVLPALIRKFHEAKMAGQETVTVWGTGSPMREFLYVDDMADGCLFVMDAETGENPMPLYNIGTGIEVTIREVAEMIGRIVGFAGKLVFDTGKPDGTPRKLLDVSRLKSLGWQAPTSLETGIRMTYDWYVTHQAER